MLQTFALLTTHADNTWLVLQGTMRILCRQGFLYSIPKLACMDVLLRAKWLPSGMPADSVKAAPEIAVTSHTWSLDASMPMLRAIALVTVGPAPLKSPIVPSSLTILVKASPTPL